MSRRKDTWAWGLAMVMLVALLVGGVVGVYFLYRGFGAIEQLVNLPTQTVDRLAAAFRPETHYETILRSSIGDLNHQPKLVVLTADVDAEVQKSSATNWGYIYWGTTRVGLRATGNKVQYFVPLEYVNTSDVSFDPAAKRLVFYIPAPQLDESMVSVQSDPSKIEVRTDLGWAKFDRWSGAPLREEARRDLRQAVLVQGRHELLLTQARTNARQQVKKILVPLAATLRDGVTLDVEFKDGK